MKPVLVATIGMAFYAAAAILIKQKLEGFNTFSILVYWYATMLPLSLGALFVYKVIDKPIAAPVGNSIYWAIGVGVAFFLADSAYISAYEMKGDVFAITTVSVLVPIFVAIIKNFLTGTWPNKYQVAGYVLAAIAIFLIVKGSPPEPAHQSLADLHQSIEASSP